MGISRATVQFLLEECAARKFQGAVATLGRQHTYFTWEQFLKFADAARVAVPAGITPTLHREPKLSAQRYVSDDALMTGLGFSELVTIDYSDYENVSELLDLNVTETPAHLQNRFDVILDLGTLEHIFHPPNVLAHIHRMLKTNGRVIHFSPAANCLDHGFYCFSPTFFADYYTVNAYQIHAIRLCRYEQKDQVNSPVKGFDYLRPKSWTFEIGSLDDKTYFTWVVAQKLLQSTTGAIPQQSSYLHQWAGSLASETGSSAALFEPAGTKADRLLKMTARWPVAHRLAEWLISTWRHQVNNYRKRYQFPLPQVCEYR